MAPPRWLQDGEPSLCEVGGKGTLLLPVFGDSEQRWPQGLRITLYLLGLGWCFMGVAIIADVFMGAIERITSQKKRRYNAERGQFYTYVVWNPTVANLTLMALGSSAPELLLNVVETCISNKMFSGDLGPSTIVGSAAFNLFSIIAVCVVAIPDGEVRRIKELPVYVVTAVFSILAYIWLLVVLLVSSPNVVEIWEGVVTFLFFPLLVAIAFIADKGHLTAGASPAMGQPRLTASAVDNEALAQLDLSIRQAVDNEALAQLDLSIRQEHGMDLPDEVVEKIMLIQTAERLSRATYRVAAIRQITGGKRVRVRQESSGRADIKTTLSNLFSGRMPFGSSKVAPMMHEDASDPAEKCFIQFPVGRYAVMEGAGSVKVKVERSGVLDAAATVQYKTRDGAAKAATNDEGPGNSGEMADYVAVEGFLEFKPYETEKTIEVKILDDNSYEDDEEFFIDLKEPLLSSDSELQTAKKVVVALRDPVLMKEVDVATAMITIIDDDYAGTLSWDAVGSAVEVEEQPTEYQAVFEVRRKAGSKGKITCKYATEDDSAFAGVDYEAAEGELEFEDGICVAKVPVRILPRGRYGATGIFRINLTQITGPGARFDASTDGGEDSCILTVSLTPNKTVVHRVDQLMSTVAAALARVEIGRSSWTQQFKEALFVNGGSDDDDEDAGPPTAMDYVLHAINLPWKIVFACCPPTDLCGGWLCFVVSLIMIGGVTVIIGDMANLFGCVIPFMENEITAITFVALGTSLPDTFASKQAAVQDPDADASVGNVTGSNSVNVFLGLGLPWTIASIFWGLQESHDEWSARYQQDVELDFLGPLGQREFGYVVKAGSLAFSVSVFAAFAVVAIVFLFVRRRFIGGELGGPKVSKYASAAFLVLLWVLYVFMSILKIKGVL